MIIYSLVNYYNYLSTRIKENIPDPLVPSYGFSEEKISYILVLNSKGELIDSISNLAGKKLLPKLMRVPQAKKKTRDISPNFLWGDIKYALGISAKKDGHKFFEAYKSYHLDLLKNETDEELTALYKFLQNWNPTEYKKFDLPFNENNTSVNVVFKLDGCRGCIHENSSAKEVWLKCVTNKSSKQYQSICLITGEMQPIALIHPNIKGVYGCQPSGGSIVSFNKDSFKFFNKEQGLNAPISEKIAFAYTTALNYLLRNDSNNFLLGDTTFVFWSQNEKAERFIKENLNDSDDEEPQTNNENEEESEKISNVFKKSRKGASLKIDISEINPNTNFYILGLSSNSSRISIRFWLDTTFGKLYNNLEDHWNDLLLEPCIWKKPPSIFKLLLETAALGKKKNISPKLVGEMTKAVIEGTRYPTSLISQIISRIHSDGIIYRINENVYVKYLRIAMIKAVLQRNFRKGLISESVPMSLDIKSENQAYLLGRLFAVLEKIQFTALGKLNSSITDKYYSSASTMPFFAFPKLLSDVQNHLSNLRKNKEGMYIKLDKDLLSIIDKLQENLPRNLNIEEQGRFAIGYYHQRSYYFITKEENNNTSIEK